jgi:hypothetical protein
MLFTAMVRPAPRAASSAYASKARRRALRPRAGEKIARDNRSAVVLATETYPEVNENFDEPIAVLGDVPEEMLGLLV